MAAEAIMARVKGCKVEAHHAKIQDFDGDFYRDVRERASSIVLESLRPDPEQADF